MTKQSLTLTLPLLCLLACSKPDAQFDEEGPNIEITQPQAGQSYPKGTTLPVEVTLSENLGLHTYFIWLVETESDQPYLVDKQHLHRRQYEIDLGFPLDELPAGSYQLQVEATDHDHNVSEKEVPIKIE